jgi:autotransporter-associated beta strand protein
MKPHFLRFRTAVSFFVPMFALSSSQGALVTVNESNATNVWTFPVGTNLLNGATAHTPSAPQQPDHGGTDQAGTLWSVLTNNTVATAANKLESITPNDGNSVIFPLNISVNTKGYNITQFDSYAGWPDTGRDNQDFTVYYSTVSAPATFVQLAVVDNNTTADLATHTRLTDSNGVLATGVHSFKFVFGIPNGQENGYAGYREFIALGTAVPVFDPLTWTGNSGSAGNANWVGTADNNWKKTSDGTPANFNPLAPLTFDSAGANRNINIPNPVTAGSLTFTNGISTDYTLGGQAITSSGVITASGAGNVTFNGVLQSPGLTFSGTGALGLNAPNPALGGNLSVAAGTLNVGHDGALGAATLTMSGGIAKFPTAAPTIGGLAGTGGSVILGNTTNPTATHLNVGGTGATTFGGTISQAAGDIARITKTGGGTLALAGDNTYTGKTTVAGGALYFNQRLSLYHGLTTSWTPANMVVNSGATLGFKIGGTGEFTDSELSTMNLGGFAAGSSLGVDTSVDYTFSRILGQDIGLSKRGPAIMTLATGNTHGGPTQVAGGTLRLANPSGPAVTGNVLLGDGSGDVFLNMAANNQFGGDSVVTIANGTASANAKLQLRGTSQTIAGLSSPTGGISIVQNDETGTPGFTSAPGVAVLTINAATNHSFRGIIRNQNGGALSLVKNGAGTQELINIPIQANSHTGATTINGGALKLNFSGTTTGWTSNVTVNAGATLQFDGLWNFTKTISGPGKVVKTGSSMVTQTNQDGNAGANSYTGGTVIQEGILKFSSNGPSSGAGDGPNQTCPAGLMAPTNIITVKNGATMGIGGTAALGNSGVLPQFAPTINVEPGGRLWGGDGSNLAFIANVNLDGAGIEITNGSNAGGFNSNIALVGTVTVTGNSPSTITTSGTGSYATASLGSIGLPGTTFQVADVTNSSSADLNISSILMDVGNVPSPLTKTGPGTMILLAENTYTGATNVLGGTLAATGNSIPDASKLVIDGGKLDIATSANESVDTLYFGTTKQPAGTYGSTASAATFKDDSRFSGTGVLTVGNVIWTAPNAISWTPTSILSWNPATDRNAPYGVSQVPLAARFAPPGSANPTLNAVLNVNSNARPNEGKIEALVGFSSSASQGTRSTRFYAPTTWQYMDVMGYWAGAVASICMPPAHVVDAAHRNGVPILGNVFLAPTAYGGNIARVNEFLTKRPDGSFPVADKMILAAQYFKFDGWFINMETAGGNSATATAMQDFLKYCKAQAPGMQISWYDSMVSNGGVAWQRRLNSANQMFFQAGATKVSDNIFLDFYWQGGNAITSSASLAQSLGRSPYDIYAGIDTEGAGDNGTNTWGGSTPIDWAQLFPPGQPHRASLGIYRPEWTFNYSGNQIDALNREIRYWSGQNSDPSNTSIPAGSGNPNWPGIANFIPAKSPLATLPFVTNFNLGQGDRFMVDGVSKMNGQWTNLSLQDILPTWKWIVSSAGTKLAPSFDYGTAYYGGTSLRVSGTLTAGQPNEIKLYQASLPVDSSTNLRLVYKPSAATAAQVQVGYAFEDAPTTMVYSSVGTSSTSNWTTLNTSLAGSAGRKIAVITLKFSSSSTIANYAVNIGRLQIANSSAAPTPPSALTLEGKGRNPDEAFGNQLWLSWTPSPDPVLHYNVYYRPDLSPANDSKRVWLGATPGSHFFAPDVRRFAMETSGYIQVEAVGANMAVSSSISTTEPTFTFESFPNLYHPVIASYPLASPLAIISSTARADNVNAYDNSILTTVEPGGHSGEWIGLDLGAGNAKRLVAIRYVPRATLAGRMVNGVFQGSNTADFSSGVVELARVNSIPPENLETTLLVTEPTAFRYVRYVSPEYGYCNLAELKLYAAGDPVTETPPVNVQATASGTTATLTWSAPYVGTPFSYNVKRATTNGGPYTIIATGIGSTSYQNTGINSGGTYYYVVSTTNGGGESANSAQVVVNPPPSLRLTGTIIGGGTPLNSDTARSKAFDANLSTYFETTDATGWSGYDFGAGNGRSIIGVRYSPRNSDTSNPNNANFMIAGRFQASNTPDFSSDVVTFITLNTTPGYNIYTSIGVSPTTATYRYVRYVTSSVRTANISEIEFYGGKVPTAPLSLTASARDTTSTLNWASVAGATRYKIQRATTSGGTYETINSNVTALTFTDTGLVAGNTYYYKVSALNAIGEGPLSAEVSTFDAYSRWLLDNGQTPGNPDTAFDQDTDADGIQNGAEYMNPGGIRTGSGITAVLRIDNFVSATLWQSADLTTWEPATLTEAVDQSDLPSGFHRVAGPQPSGEAKTFYRLKFLR